MLRRPLARLAVAALGRAPSDGLVRAGRWPRNSCARARLPVGLHCGLRKQRLPARQLSWAGDGVFPGRGARPSGTSLPPCWPLTAPWGPPYLTRVPQTAWQGRASIGSCCSSHMPSRGLPLGWAAPTLAFLPSHPRAGWAGCSSGLEAASSSAREGVVLRGGNRLGLLTPPTLSGAAQTEPGSCTRLRRDVRTEARRPERTIGGREEHPAQEAPAGAQQHLRVQRVPHHEEPAAWRGERQRLLLCDQGGDAARHCGGRLHRARGVLGEPVRDQQSGRAGRAGHEPHLRAGRGPPGRAQHQEDGPAAYLHLRAAALAGSPGAAAAPEENGD